MSIFGSYDSSEFVDILDSIEHAKTNDILVSRCSESYLIDGYTVQSPVSIYDEYWELIEGDTVTVAVNDTEKYRPEEMAKRLYGSRDLAFIIKRLNGIYHSRDFTISTALVLNPQNANTISKILRASEDRLSKYRSSQTVVTDLTLRPVPN